MSLTKKIEPRPLYRSPCWECKWIRWQDEGKGEVAICLWKECYLHHGYQKCKHYEPRTYGPEYTEDHL